MTTRTTPPQVAGEREQLSGFLDFLREAVVVKATGLTGEQARKQLVPSPRTTVAGLVSHLTYVEQYWFGVLLDGRPDPWRERFATDPDAEFTAGMSTPITELVENYVQECARSRAVAAELDMDATVMRGDAPVNLRWVLIHMIEETGRHAGHLDLLRELLDGSTGE
jgi:uncharacterized damage-inducible protein DinB